MSKVIPLTKNHKNYEDVPDTLKWALAIHECLEKPEVKKLVCGLKLSLN